jgi:7,8-dihydropterin-6-yl-methyl-4-(beta-D-ribofuranosyl)aminobenzene 5'-phosphate synthase
MKIKIVTLIENLVYQQGLFAEHGLSVYIETESSKILFDTGQSGLFLQNAHKMGIEIKEIDFLVLSHGHYDHTGGLYPFLEKNKKARIYAKKEVFIPKYKSHQRFIGTLQQDELLKDRLQFADKITEIAENVFVMPDILVTNPDDTHFTGLYKIADKELITDEFEDELFLAIRRNNRINILTACSHRGITNICTTATDYFKLPVGLILGGFHLKDSKADQFDQIIQYFKKLNPKSIGVCHCTGVEKYAAMQHACDIPLFYNFTGKEIILNEA